MQITVFGEPFYDGRIERKKEIIVLRSLQKPTIIRLVVDILRKPIRRGYAQGFNCFYRLRFYRRTFGCKKHVRFRLPAQLDEYMAKTAVIPLLKEGELFYRLP